MAIESAFVLFSASSEWYAVAARIATLCHSVLLLLMMGLSYSPQDTGLRDRHRLTAVTVPVRVSRTYAPPYVSTVPSRDALVHHTVQRPRPLGRAQP